jgi:hypothetical protein
MEMNVLGTNLNSEGWIVRSGIQQVAGGWHHCEQSETKPEPTKYVVDAALAAQDAANQADALLDSLQMPRLPLR